MKPYYEKDGIVLYCADCREILPLLPSADLVLTDPPYDEVNRGTNGLRNLDKGDADTATMSLEVLCGLLAGLAPTVYAWCGTEQVSEPRKWFVYAGMSTRLCIWEKANPSPMNGEYLWLSGLECCVYGKLPKATFNEFCKTPVFRGPAITETKHPTEKPLWLFKRLMLASSNPGDVVLDPFAGSGTTLLAAKQLGRSAIGIERNEDYCRMAVQRLAQEVMDFSEVA